MGDVTRMDDVVSVAIWGVGCTPPPKFFCPYFTKIQTHWTTKNWGSVPSPLGVPPPYNFVNILNAAWLGAFTRILPMVGLCRFWLDFDL